MQHNWLSDSTDTVNAFHASINATIIPKKLDFNSNGSYSVNQPNGDITMRWPAFEDGYARLDAALQHPFTKSLAIDQKNSWTQIVGVTLKYKFE